VLPRRWRHVRTTARRARWVADRLTLSDDLVAAAWLHDIGYAPELAETRFHPLDGARYLRRAQVREPVVSLVAYPCHSCGPIEADVRSLGELLAKEFLPGDPVLTDALLYCGVTTGPDGDYVHPAYLLVEIVDVTGLSTRSRSSSSWPPLKSWLQALARWTYASPAERSNRPRPIAGRRTRCWLLAASVVSDR
jgi:hypothetical protein